MELSRAIRPALRLPFRTSRNINHCPNTSANTLRNITTKSIASGAVRPSTLAHSLPSTSDPCSSSLRNLTTSSAAPAARPSITSGLNLFGKSLQAGQVARAAQTYLDYNIDQDSKHLRERQPWHLHVYATKHNTHLTLTRPNRDAVISISAGQIGFKKAARGSYDAAYQLGAYLMARIQRAGLLAQIDETELVFRGHGSGREAISKILTGSEGALMRHKIKSVTDSTRLKFGGTRSPKKRRLG